MTETPEKPKLSHGGARPNAGAKKNKPASVAIRVDARLVELVETLKHGFKLGTVEQIELDNITKDIDKRNRNWDDNYTPRIIKTSDEYAAEYKKRLNDAIDKHGAKLKGGMTLFDLLQKCIKDGATLIKNGVITEGELITKFIAAHGLERFDEIEAFDQLREMRRA